MATATLSRVSSLERQIVTLQARRVELRAQLYAIAGAQAQADRETAVMDVTRAIERLQIRVAGLLMAE